MGMNDTPSGERVHIGFFGRRNAGKSSLVNAVTGQDLAERDSGGRGTGNLRKRTGTVSDLGAERENCPSGAGFCRTESAGA